MGSKKGGGAGTMPDGAGAVWALFEDALSAELAIEIRDYLQQVLGTDRFRAWVEARAGRFVTLARLADRLSARIVPDTFSTFFPIRVA